MFTFDHFMYCKHALVIGALSIAISLLDITHPCITAQALYHYLEVATSLDSTFWDSKLKFAFSLLVQPVERMESMHLETFVHNNKSTQSLSKAISTRNSQTQNWLCEV